MLSTPQKIGTCNTYINWSINWKNYKMKNWFM